MLSTLEKHDQANSDSLAAALQVDLTHIAQQCPRAVEILQQCAFLAPRAIPDALFTRFSPSEAIELLLAYGLIARQDQAGQFDMNSLLQTGVRQLMPLDQRQERVEQVLYALDQYISSLGEETGTPSVSFAVSHVQQVASYSTEWTLSSQEAAEVFAWGAEILYKQANIQEAEPLLRQSLPIWERALGPTHPAIGAVLLNLANLNFRLKNYPPAEFFAQWAIRAQSQASAANYTSIIFSLNHLGHIYAEQGKQNEARLCYQKALAFATDARLQGHPFCITAAYELAMLDIKQERFAEAEALLHQVCIGWNQSPDAAYPSTIQAWQAFAKVSFELEKWQQAAECYQRLLPIYEQTVGNEHPETVHCLEQEVIVYKMQDKLDEAKATMQRLLRAKERMLPPESPELASSLNDLAEIVIVQRQFAEALPLLEQAQKIYTARPEDITLDRILMNLAAVYAAQQDHEQAILSLEQSLAIKTRVLGSNHPDLGENMDALALLYASQNRLEETETMLQRALAIGEQGTETSGMERAGRLLALGQVSLARDLPAQAEGYLQQALTVAQTSHVVEPLFTALLLDNLAAAEIMQGKSEEAIEYLQQALLFRVSVPGIDRPDLVGNLFALSISLRLPCVRY